MTPKLLPDAFTAFCQSALDLAFPNSCLICDQLLPQHELICPPCFINNAKLCSQYIGKQQRLEVFSLFPYQAPFHQVVLEKFGEQNRLLKGLGRLLWQTPGFAASIKACKLEKWFIVPVPLHWKRLWWRGFNQATILAGGLSSQAGFEVVSALYRPKNTLPQRLTSTKEARQLNLKNAIKLNSERWLFGYNKAFLQQQFKQAGIILVDDLLTSGATLLECQQQLKLLKPAKIIAITACRG